jgi:glutamate/tyrosine decarboxylase-like PLP-dependent enzyme
MGVMDLNLGAEIPAQGLAKADILSTLRGFKDRDLPWKSGRVLAYTYDPGDESLGVATEAYLMFLTENGLDPTTFPSMHRLETDIVHILRDLLRGGEAVVGNCTSGGTESNLCAVKAARDWNRAHRPHITQPELILPRTAHPSFHKACAYFNIKPVITGFDPVTFRADVNAMRSAVTKNTILLVASAPGYAQGVVDPIAEIGQLALERELLFHVDGCVGGIPLSFFRRMGGYTGPDFDFSVPGVSSISADMHKFGYAPKNISSVLYRDKELRKHSIFACRATTTYALINTTVLSTKSGGPLAGAWALLHYLGEAGYRAIVGPVMDATRCLVAGVNAIEGLRILGNPDMSMFSFTSNDFNIFQLADEMRDRGWYIQPQFSTDNSPANLHVTVTRATVQHVDAFLNDLASAARAVKASANPIDLAGVRTQVRGLIEALGSNAVDQLKSMAGMEGTDVPQHMALINSVMDALPDEIAERLLTEFLNDLYV